MPDCMPLLLAAPDHYVSMAAQVKAPTRHQHAETRQLSDVDVDCPGTMVIWHQKCGNMRLV